MKRLYLLIFLIFTGFFHCFPQRAENAEDIIINLNEKDLTARDILKALNETQGISIVYNASGQYLDQIIQLDKKQQSLKKILDQVCHQIPYSYSFHENYIILKMNQMEKSCLLSGRVFEKSTGKPVISANLFITELNKGNVSDIDGRFSFELKPGIYTLNCTYIGYKSVMEEIRLFKNIHHDIYLEELPQEISEVKIISRKAGDEKNIESGRNIETLSENDLKYFNANIAANVFQGRINGLWASNMSGAPGEHVKIQIRGINSLFASTDPLFVIDGLPVPNVNLSSLGIADLNVRDIEKIQVYKDAASTAYYGYQGANGVILIDTKKGGKKQVNFGTRQGIQYMNKRYDLMNSRDFLNTFKLTDTLFYSNDIKFYKEYTGFYKYYNELNQPVVVNVDTQRYVYPLYNDALSSQDYQDKLFTPGHVSEYYLNGSGNVKGFNYYISGDFFDHRGIVRNTAYRRYTLTSNLGKKFKNGLKMELSYRGSKQENHNNMDNYMGNNNILKVINIEPEYESLDPFYRQLYRSYLPSGTEDNPVNMDMYKINEMYPSYQSSVPMLYIGNLENPLDLFSRDSQRHNLIINNLSGRLNYEIFPGLELEALASLSSRKNTFTSNLFKIAGDASSEQALYLASKENYMIMNQSLSLGYSRSAGKHSFHIAGTYRNYMDYAGWDVDSSMNVSLDAIDKTTSGYIKGSNAVYGPKGDILRNIRSLIGHFRYIYNEKYSLSFFLNIDHLEEGDNIKINNVFPSVAFNWNVLKELGKSRPGWLSSFDIFTNRGMAGNYPLNGLSNDIFSDVTADLKKIKAEGKYISNLANHFLQPEKLTETNIGTKISFFNQKISLSVDYFLKNNRNLVVQRDIPYYYGGGKFMYNIGSMKNQGIELSAELSLFNFSGISWTSRLGYSKDNQVVTKINDSYDTLAFQNDNILIPDFDVIVNSPPGVIKGYKCAGKWQETDASGENQYLESYGLRYLNADSSDNLLTENDKVVLGKSIPDFSLFWNNSFTFKSFHVDFLWYAVIGVNKFNATRASTFYTGRNAGIGAFVADTLNPHMDQIFYESSYFVEDASFIRLKNISFTYSPQQPVFRIMKASFSLSFENLITFTRYKGYDPEASIYTDNNFSDYAVDFGAYPSPQSIYFSIDLTF